MSACNFRVWAAIDGHVIDYTTTPLPIPNLLDATGTTLETAWVPGAHETRCDPDTIDLRMEREGFVYRRIDGLWYAGTREGMTHKWIGEGRWQAMEGDGVLNSKTPVSRELEA